MLSAERRIIDALIAELKIQAAKDQAEITNTVNRLDQSQSELAKALDIVSQKIVPEKDALIAELKAQATTDQSKKSKS